MGRSQELFEILGRKSRQAASAATSQAPTSTGRKRSAAKKQAPEAEARRAADPVPARSTREVSAPAAADASRAEVHGPKTFELSAAGAALLGIFGALLIALAYIVGAWHGRQGEPLSPVMSVTASGGGAKSGSDSGATRGSAVESSAAARQGDDETTYTVRAATYPFSRANNQRAEEVRSYLTSQGLRDVAVRLGQDGKEIRVYAGRYSRPDDPALLDMQNKLRAVRGDDKWGKFPFKTAYIQPLPPAKRGE